jgi:CRISPR-associated endonuclease/helicase Cas3
VRPWDRERLLRDYLDRIRADRPRRPGDRPLFVVATQTVEVGADLDFDFLVTEAAPLPALRQRFGRLDRLGQFGQAGGVVLRRKVRESDPIYGDELDAAWHWLRERAGSGDEVAIDFGIDALDALIARSPEPPRSEPRHAPVLLPAHLDTWAQTCPTPRPDPDVAPFLHGADALDAADIVIVWRADLAWDEVGNPGQIKQDWVEAVSVARPVVLEGLPVAAGSARAWLAGVAGAEVADVEGRAARAEPPRRPSRRLALRWRGPDDSELVGPDDIRPGDTLVVPSAYGGADRFGWAPSRREPVEDVGDACFNWMADAAPDAGRAQPVRLRLHPALYRQLLGLPRDATEDERLQQFQKHLTAASWVAEGEGEGHEALDQVLRAYREAAAADQRMAAAIVRFQAAAAADRLKPAPYPSGLVVTLPVEPGFSGAAEPLPPDAVEAAEPSGEDDAASLVRRSVSLEDHTSGVANRVRQFAAGCGLSEPLVRVLEQAARLHDLGKADPRFQVMLHGDAVAAAAAGELLAKSGLDREDAAAFRAAWRLSGLPRGFRHEFVSVALIRRHRDELLHGLSPEERELVEYLVGTHHGRGRAFAPVVPERDSEPVALDWEGTKLSASPDHGLWRLGSGWTDLFWRLVRRHGYWGLAYLEAVLVLADQARSRDEDGEAR